MTAPKLELATSAETGPILRHGSSGYGYRRCLEIRNGVDPRLESRNGASLANPGIRRAPEGYDHVDINVRGIGETEEASYFRTTPWFETGGWIARSILIGAGRRTPPERRYPSTGFRRG